MEPVAENEAPRGAVSEMKATEAALLKHSPEEQKEQHKIIFQSARGGLAGFPRRTKQPVSQNRVTR